MAKSYRMIASDEAEVTRQLAVMSAQNREGKGPAEKPILLSTSTVTHPNTGATAVKLFVIVESE
jgi:hypothetical protein